MKIRNVRLSFKRVIPLSIKLQIIERLILRLVGFQM
jgi:hypothetical protein